MGFPAQTKQVTSKRLDVRWKECASNLASALHQALHTPTWNNVKLVAASDGGCFHASQMVLASASPFLKQLLLELEKEEEPVIVLTEVKAETLQDLLTFVYQGEVKLGPTRLASLLSLAQTLDIYAIKELETSTTHALSYPRRSSPPPFTGGLSLLASAALTAEDQYHHGHLVNDENDPHVFTPSSNSISAHSNANAGAMNLSMKNNDYNSMEIEDNSSSRERIVNNSRLVMPMSILNIPDPNHFKWKRAFMHCISPASFSSGMAAEMQSASDALSPNDRSPPPLAIDMTDSSTISANDHPSIIPELPATPSPSPSSLVGTPSCFGESSPMLEEKSSSSPLLIQSEMALEEPKSLSLSSTSNEGKRWKSRQPKLCIHCDRYFSNQFNLKQVIQII